MTFMDLPPKAVLERELGNPASVSRATLATTIATVGGPMFASPRFARPQPFRNQPQLTVMTTFQTGHGWTANTGTWTADTAIYALGSQSIKTTVTSALAATYRKFAQPATDVSDRDFAVLIKVDVPTELDQLQLYVGGGGMTNYEAMVLGRGGISAGSTIMPNVWTWVYFTWADVGNPFGSPNRGAVTDWQVRVVGKSATPVTVWVNAVAHYPRKHVFPNGCVSFACDDGRLSQYTRMAPALDKYGYGATAYLITEYLGTANKMTYAQAKELEAYHRWEIAGHAYTMAAHDNGMTSLSLSALDTELRLLRDWLQQGNHKGADLFAYPLGYDNPDVVEVVSRYFVNARQIVRAPYQNTDLDQPYRMRSNSMSSSDLLATAKTWVDKTVANGTWFTITMHDIVDGAPASGTEWSTADFQGLVDYVAASGAEVLPVGAALDKINGHRPTVAPINGGTP